MFKALFTSAWHSVDNAIIQTFVEIFINILPKYVTFSFYKRYYIN